MRILLAIVAVSAASFLLVGRTPVTANPAKTETRTLAEIKHLNPQLSQDTLGLGMKLRSLITNEYKFFRGTADLFYTWCGTHCQDWLADEAARVTLHGDVHIGNVGTYRIAGESSRKPGFSVVDLDEVFEGPFQLDLLRSLTSIRFMAAANELEVTSDDWQLMSRLMCEAYVTGFEEKEKPGVTANRHPIVASLLEEARAARRREHLGKYVTGVLSPRFRTARIKKNTATDLMDTVSASERRAIVNALWKYVQASSGGVVRSYITANSASALNASILDVARWTRLGSSGSQGLHKYLVLVQTPMQADPIILQLKEEPVPAAARAGLIATVSAAQRAEQVADGYRLLLDPPKWLVGHAEVDGRGYLVKTKDPWSKEPDPQDFDSREKLKIAARLMGELIGRAHRQSTKNGALEIVSSVTSRRFALDLAGRSERVGSHLTRMYEDLCADPAAQKSVQQARMHIEKKSILAIRD